ncbi:MULTISPECIES: hypothetical protein [Streptomyces]|uniref:Lipoprotein n=1 Tax=Streptomyces koelreuteriae TaxID=2838015 RepID=A0ABX8FQ89_9ACTN|nr:MULTISPECIES: hypothetical protein [Streptomyces]QWB23329.1 hypothetical protein KJK29_12340 [Streptomyces koelreuteriae]UUA06281.1 hypothetical protein NNW98_12395 [Streptomyces koelreuteriae]UUA13908.1 hypothetical protein NNW99_12395 [Streptomyces sp. CRCS-T-1]
MNRRPTLLAALTLTAAAALTLSACGSDDSSKSKDNDKIAGADTGEKASASPSESAAESADRPKIDLPSDLSYTFDWPKSGDKEKDAVLADSEQSIKAVDMAIANQDALDKPYLYYFEGEAAASTQKFIQNYVDHKASITGVYRFYAPEVAVDKDGTASLSYCEDQGKAYVKYLKTDKVKKTEVTAKSYVIYHTSLKKNDKGVWVIQKMISQSGSAKCRP